MVLIPKTPDADEVTAFRPIVLSNFLFKVVTRILADRLSVVAARIISPNQFGFLKGRSISECIALGSEGVNLLHKRCFGDNMAMKINITKAFDTLD